MDRPRRPLRALGAAGGGDAGRRALQPQRTATEMDAIFPSSESLRKEADLAYQPRGGEQPRAGRLYADACDEGDLPSCARLEQMRVREQLSGAAKVRADRRKPPGAGDRPR
ncbi:MAG: hypothetical protein NVSMB23_01190 [Myxococcales bacterium]